MDDIIKSIILFYSNTWVSVGLLVLTLMIFVLGLLFVYFYKSSFFVFFELIFEKIYDFFEEIIWNEEKRRIKVYITLMFFIILFSNLIWVFLEILKPIFGVNDNWVYNLDAFILIPTADINFNLAMAIIGLVIIIFEQFKALGFWKALYVYFPILGQNYIPYSRGTLKPIFDWPLFLLVKVFDIIISLFLGLLEIVWHFAKLISLSFRLFWNVTSGGILISMLVVALSSLTNSFFGFDFPVLWTVILYLQSLLVALIQALVFPLLIAIFIKVAKFS